MKKNTRLFVYVSMLTILLYGIAGYHFLTGWPPFLMMLLAILIGLGLHLLVYTLMNLLFKKAKKVPIPHITAVLSGIIVCITLKLFGFGWPLLVYAVAVTVGLLVIVSLHGYLTKKSITTSLALGFTLLGVLFVVYSLAKAGVDPYEKELPLAFSDNNGFPLGASLENPATEGEFAVHTFTYGSGTDEKRTEFASGATYTTRPVNGTWVIPEWKDKMKKWRERFWGFGAENFPLNGRVYMPKGEGPFPLTLILHGNHSMIDYSDDGYGYLGALLASRGIIAVSVDENFLNGHWSGDFMGAEMPARAWLLLKHLEQWRNWNAEPGHDLSKKVDMNRIMLIGHSRGGEAVSIAAAYNTLRYFPDQAKQTFDFNFNIKGVVALAPTDYRYVRKINLENVNFLSLQGSYDSDEVSFWGMRPYRRLQFTDTFPKFKAGVYIHHANHGQFNSTWGNSDFGAPTKWLLNLKPLLLEAEQQEVAKVFISAFAEATLKENPAYLPIFKNVSVAKQWLPIEYYLTHFEPSMLNKIANFEEDIDLTTTSKGTKINATHLALWKESYLPTRDEAFQENNAVVLGWDAAKVPTTEINPEYSLEVSSLVKTDLNGNSTLQMAIGVGNHEWLYVNYTEEENKVKNENEEDREIPNLDFSIRLTDETGTMATLKVSDIKAIPKPLKTRFTKFEFLDTEMIGADWEVQLQTFHFPLQSFIDKNPNFKPDSLKTISFIFDQTPYGVVVVDDIAIAN